MEQQGSEVQFEIEDVGVLRISLLNGEVSGLKDILERVDRKKASEIAGAVNSVGEGLEESKNYGAAALVYLAAIQFAEKSGDRLNTAAILINFGLALKLAKAFEPALDAYQKAIAYLAEPAEQTPAAESRRTAFLANALSVTAGLHLARSSPAEAEKAAEWCMELLRYQTDDFSKSTFAQCERVLQEAGILRMKLPPAKIVVGRAQ
jgi:tetratricopeptide (TPR) repeat protein